MSEWFRTWNVYLWGRKNSWKVHLPPFGGYFRMPSVREKAVFFFFNLSSKNALISEQVWPKMHCESWGLVSAVWAQILHFESQHGGQGLNTLPGEGDLASHGGWVACAPQEDKQRKQRDQEHKLANTWHGMNFKKHVLFLKSWQQFLQTLKPLRGLLPFPASLFLVFIYLFTGEHGSLARSCQMNKLLFGEASWLRYLI